MRHTPAPPRAAQVNPAALRRLPLRGRITARETLGVSA